MVFDLGHGEDDEDDEAAAAAVAKTSSIKFADTVEYIDLEAAAPVLTVKYLESNYEFCKLKSDNIIKSTNNYFFKSFRPSRVCCKGYMSSRVPAIAWLRAYDLKQNLLNDFIAGLTVIIITPPLPLPPPHLPNHKII